MKGRQEMKKKYIFGGLFVIAGLLTALGPKTLFAVCDSDGDMIMKCYYVAQTELGIGIETALFGGLLAILKSEKAQVAVSTAIGLNGILIFLIPNVLIGVCKNEHMNCNAVTKPFLSIIGIGVTLLAVFAALLLHRKETKTDA